MCKERLTQLSTKYCLLTKQVLCEMGNWNFFRLLAHSQSVYFALSPSLIDVKGSRTKCRARSTPSGDRENEKHLQASLRPRLQLSLSMGHGLDRSDLSTHVTGQRSHPSLVNSRSFSPWLDRSDQTHVDWSEI